MATPRLPDFRRTRGQQPAAANAGPAERSFSNARQTAQGELAVAAREEADWAPVPNRPEPDANVGTFPGDGGIIRALHARYSAPKRLDETAAVFSEIMAAPDKAFLRTSSRTPIAS